MSCGHPGFEARVNSGEHAAVEVDVVVLTCGYCETQAETYSAEERDDFFSAHRHGTVKLLDGAILSR